MGCFGALAVAWSLMMLLFLALVDAVELVQGRELLSHDAQMEILLGMIYAVLVGIAFFIGGILDRMIEWKNDQRKESHDQRRVPEGSEGPGRRP